MAERMRFSFGTLIKGLFQAGPSDCLNWIFTGSPLHCFAHHGYGFDGAFDLAHVTAFAIIVINFRHFFGVAHDAFGTKIVTNPALDANRGVYYGFECFPGSSFVFDGGSR